MPAFIAKANPVGAAAEAGFEIVESADGCFAFGRRDQLDAAAA
jgi:hypothetical protein